MYITVKHCTAWYSIKPMGIIYCMQCRYSIHSILRTGTKVHTTHWHTSTVAECTHTYVRLFFSYLFYITSPANPPSFSINFNACDKWAVLYSFVSCRYFNFRALCYYDGTFCTNEKQQQRADLLRTEVYPCTIAKYTY